VNGIQTLGDSSDRGGAVGGQNFVTLGPIPDPANDLVTSTGFGGASNGGVFNVVQNVAATIVAGSTGKRIYVFGVAWTTFNAATGEFTFVEVNSSGATVTTPYGVTAPANGSNFVLPYQQYPWFTTSPGNALGVVSQGANTINVYGRVLYMQG